MKKTIIAVILLALLIAAYFEYNSYRQKKYAKISKETVARMVTASISSERVCNFYSTVWKDAIYKEGNYFEGKYSYKEFNQALAIAREDNNNSIKELKVQSDTIKQNMGKLIDPPSKYKDVYLAITKLYGYTNEYISLAESPTGSLTSFNQKTNEISSNILKLRDEIIIQLPE